MQSKHDSDLFTEVIIDAGISQFNSHI